MMRDEDVATLLRRATDGIDVPPAPVEALTRTARRRRVRRRLLGAVAGSVALAAVAVGAPLALGTRQATPSAGSGPSHAGCTAKPPLAVLPTWARTGFSDPRPRMPYVWGGRRDIIAILWGPPLHSPPSADHFNKILWVQRPLAGDAPPSNGYVRDADRLRIDARLSDGSAHVVRTVSGGPGPSIIDLPKPGCWHLSLSWYGRTDSLDLSYTRPD